MTNWIEFDGTKDQWNQYVDQFGGNYRQSWEWGEYKNSFSWEVSRFIYLTENKVTIDLIQTLVCKFFKISKNEMLSSRRSRYLVRPRQTAIYLSKILTSKSLPEIGREFSNRDHTTIIHSVKTIEKIKEKDQEMVDNINKLKNQILYNNKENEI